MAHIFCRLRGWLVLALAVGVLSARLCADTGTFAGGQGTNGTWTTDGTDLTVEGSYTSDYNGDQIVFEVPSGVGQVAGPQASGPGQVKNFILSFGVTGASGTFGFAIYSTDGGSVPAYKRTNIAGLSWTFEAPTFKVTISLSNSRDVAVTYKLMQGANEIGSVVLQPNTGLIQTFTTSNADPVNVLEQIPNLQQDGPVWVVVEGAVHSVPVGNVTPVLVPSGGPNPPAVSIPQSPAVPSVVTPPPPVVVTPTAPVLPVNAPAPAPVAPAAPVTPLPNPTPAGTDPVKKADTEKQTNDLTTALNNQQTANTAAINAVITAVNASAVAGTNGSNGIIAAVNKGTSVLDKINGQLAAQSTGTNARLDAIKANTAGTAANTSATVAKLDTLHTDLQKLAPSEAQTAAVAAANSSMAAAGDSAGSAAAGLFSSATVAGHSISGSGTAPNLSVTMPVAFGGATFDFNPFSSERFAVICGWFRTACAWLALVTLGVWVWTQTRGWLHAFSGLQQAKGNTVVAGTGGQATAFLAAGLMTAALVTAITGLMAWSFGDISFALIKTVVGTTNPLATMPAAVFWMCDQLFPVATLCACLVARASFNMYAAPLFAFCQAVVRFIVP